MSENNKNLFEENNNFDENNSNNVNETNAEQDFVNDTDTVYFSDPPSNENREDGAVPLKQKEKRRISIKAFVISLIAVCVASVMLTYTICSALYQSLYAKAYTDANQNSHLNGNVTSTGISELDIIAQFIIDNFYGEVDSKKLMQTGDVYAAYYTQAELDALLREDVGKMAGIGVNIINDKTVYKGVEISVLKVINVMEGSPAEKGGVKIGDYIYAAIIDGAVLKVDDLGYVY